MPGSHPSSATTHYLPGGENWIFIYSILKYFGDSCMVGAVLRKKDTAGNIPDKTIAPMGHLL